MSVNSSGNPLTYLCFDSPAAVPIFNSFIITKILLCGPLSILVLYLGHQQWQQQQRSTTTASHSDVFTYNMAVLELSCLVACIFYFYGSYADFPGMATSALYVISMAFAGEMCFHCLTCVERYLAVVHPVIYRNLRQSGGVRIRNISIVCVWLLCFGWIGIKTLYAPNFPIIPYFLLLALSLLVTSFCSLSVLCALIRPGPGDVGGTEKRTDQSKQRAFHTVMTILAVLWLWFVGNIVCFALEASPSLTYSDGCVVMMSGMWFSLQSSFVSPLLFLHRAGKLPCCHYSNDKQTRATVD